MVSAMIVSRPAMAVAPFPAATAAMLVINSRLLAMSFGLSRLSTGGVFASGTGLAEGHDKPVPAGGLLNFSITQLPHRAGHDPEHDMKVGILAGGVGSRLSEETAVKPKPMVEIGGRPILWHIMMYYATYGFKEFVVALGYKGEQIKRYMADYCSLASDLRVSLASGEVKRHNHGNGTPKTGSSTSSARASRPTPAAASAPGATS
jgi:hypothetical protein